MEIIDLTREIKNEKLLPPNPTKEEAESFPSTVVTRFEKLSRRYNSRNGSMMSFPIHSLTHFDFPYHKFKEGKKCMDYGLSKFIGRAQVTDSESHIPKSEIVLFKNSGGISLETAKRLLKKKIVGTDNDTIGNPKDPVENTKTHRLLLKNDVLIIESLTNLEKLGKRDFLLLAIPLKVNADGSPVRVVAMPNASLVEDK